MADKVALELVAPERVLASREVDMVVVPSVDGELGVLPNHAPVLALLQPGIIRLYEADKVVEQIFVAGGFAEINEEGCIVLADRAEPLDEIDAGSARQRLGEAEEDLRSAQDPSDAERLRLEQAVTVARARIEAAEAR